MHSDPIDPATSALRRSAIWLVPLAIVALGIALSAILALQASENNKRNSRLVLTHEAEVLVHELEDAFTRSAFGLYGLRGTFAALGRRLDHQQFANYVKRRDLPSEFPGIRGFGFIEHVPAGQIDAYQRRVGVEDASDFSIRHLGPVDPENQFVIRWIEPPDGNQGARGLNIGSEARRLAAAQQAIDSGATTFTAQIKLVQDRKQTPGLLLFVPVYAQGGVPATVAERRRQLLGLLYAPIVISELITARADEVLRELCVSLRDPGEHDPWFQHQPEGPDHSCRGDPVELPIAIFNHTLNLSAELTEDRAKAIAGLSPTAVVLEGTLLSLSLAVIAYLLLAGRTRAQRKANQMTEAFRQANEDLEQTLLRSEDLFNRLNDVLEATHVGTWELNLATGAAYVNTRWAAIIGYTLDELKPITIETCNRHAHPDDLAQYNALLERHFARELDHFTCELRVRHKDGRWVWVMDRGRVSKWSAQGKPLLVAGMRHDISEAKANQARLEQSERRFRTMSNAAPVLIWIADAGADRTWFNKTWLDFTGRGMDLELGNGWADGVHPADSSRCGDAYATHFAARTAFVIDYRLRRHDGHYRWIRESGVPRFADDGGFEGYMGSCTDIHDQKTLEARLTAANRAKNEFLTSMSHELRTPLNAVLGFAQLLAMDAELHADARNSAKEIERAGNHLLGLVNDLIDLSRIESGKMDLSIECCDLRPVLREALAMVAPLADRHAVQLERAVCGEVRAGWMARCDPHRLRQSVINLLANAIKYNRPLGTVALRCEERPADTAAPTGWLRLSVEDTGPGIPAEKQSRLFTPFDRLGREAGSIEGTGIGLVICRRLIEAMGGSLDFDSVEGRGSRFWIDLQRCEADAESETAEPAAEASAPRDPGASTADRPKATVLYVEDNLLNIRLMQRIFKMQTSCALMTAARAEDGIGLARAHLPALILMDINMPGMDGFAALKALREDARTARIPVAAITANAMKGDRERCLEAGFSEYLSKPVELPAILALIARVGQLNSDHPGAMRIDQGLGRVAAAPPSS